MPDEKPPGTGLRFTSAGGEIDPASGTRSSTERPKLRVSTQSVLLQPHPSPESNHPESSSSPSSHGHPSLRLHLPPQQARSNAQPSASVSGRTLQQRIRDSEFEGWLLRDDRDRWMMGPRAVKHHGELLAGVPSGYLRTLLRLRGLPPKVRVVFLQYTHQFCPNPHPESTDWMPFLIGDIQGWLHKDVYACFIEEYARLSRVLSTESPTVVIEAMVANSHTTPLESLF